MTFLIDLQRACKLRVIVAHQADKWKLPKILEKGPKREEYVCIAGGLLRQVNYN